MDYQEIVERRRALVIEPYKSLAEVGFDGPWVTPYQITSKSPEGPVLVALHWLDESSILTERATLQHLGYLPTIRFNNVINTALARQGLSRPDIYVTQSFILYRDALGTDFTNRHQTLVRRGDALRTAGKEGDRARGDRCRRMRAA